MDIPDYEYDCMDTYRFDENRRVTFGYVDNNNQIVEVKVPLDGVEVNAVSATE